MTDRELLESAAKAVRLEYASVLLGSTLSGGIILKDRAGYWNPLTDDGDALRLAVKLELCINVIGDGMAEIRREGQTPCWEHEAINYDTAAATRRAIVRAAAAMAVG